MQKTEAYSNEFCQDCPHNPHPTKPLKKLQKFQVDKLTYAHAEEYARQHGVKASCLFCEIAQEVVNGLKNPA